MKLRTRPTAIILALLGLAGFIGFIGGAAAVRPDVWSSLIRDPFFGWMILYASAIWLTLVGIIHHLNRPRSGVGVSLSYAAFVLGAVIYFLVYSKVQRDLFDVFTIVAMVPVFAGAIGCISCICTRSRNSASLPRPGLIG